MVAVGRSEKADEVAIRRATPADVPVLEALIHRSATGLNAGLYTPAELAAASAHVFGVDSELIADGTYFVAAIGGEAAGCGGWSARRTLFGRDGATSREAGRLDPARDPARIRAFFVDPAFARRGVAAALLARCEVEARAAGFTRAALMATLPGVPFYQAAGFIAGEAGRHEAGGVPVRFVPMAKDLGTTEPGRATGHNRHAPVPQADQQQEEGVP